MRGDVPSFPTGRLRAAQVLFLSLALSLLAATAARRADASIVVAKGGSAPHVATARMAIAENTQRSVVWEQLSFDPDTSGELAWIVAVPKGGFIEGADPTWFEALDGVSAPIIAPSKSLGCYDAGYETTAAPKTTAPPRPIDRALFSQTTGAIALDRLKAAGYVVDAPTAAMLASVDALGEEVAVLHLPPAVGSTRVIRVLGPPSRPLPVTLAPNGVRSTKLLVWVLASSRMKIAGVPAMEPAFDRLAWLGTQSNYASLLDDTLSSVVASFGVAVPFASPDAMFADQPTGTVGRTVPSLVRAYFGADDDAPTGPWICAKQATSFAASDKTVALSCAKPPTWTTDATPPTCADPPPDSLAVADFVCAAHDDLGVALGGARPSHTWITRFESWSAPRVVPVNLEETSLGSLPVFHEAKSLGTGACPPVTGNPPGSGGDPTGATDPNSGYDPGTSNQPYPPNTQVIVHDGCSSSGAGTGCGKSSSSSTSDDGCSKKDGGSSDSGCGSSSSSSSDSGCGKGSSSSSSDSGCGGSSSGSSGGGCGGASSGADKGCSVSTGVRGAFRLKFSVLGYLAAAIATVLRRATRKRKG